MTTRVSLAPNGAQGNLESREPAFSADDLTLAFSSAASNLVAADGNATTDIFVRDLATGATSRVSVASGGFEANGRSDGPSISTDGGVIAFQSSATNLVAGDTNDVLDVFVHERRSKTTVRVSVSTAGAQATAASRFASISGDGLRVAFESASSGLVAGDGNGASDVFLRDLALWTTTRVSVGASGLESNGASQRPILSSDGRSLAFQSAASNLVSGDTNGSVDVFVRDLDAGTTTRVSIGSGGAQGTLPSTLPSLSHDGRVVAYSSFADTLVAGDVNGTWDIFVHDRDLALTQRITVDVAGGATNGPSSSPAISSSGRFVAFTSMASDLIAGDDNSDWDVFVHDRETGQTTRASSDSGGLESNGASLQRPVVSSDGRLVAFASVATNLVPSDTNGDDDVFLHDRAPLSCPTIASYCVSKLDAQGCLPVLAATGPCSATSGGGCAIAATHLTAPAAGTIVYSTAGSAEAPFGGGLLCVRQAKRAPTTGLSGATPCSGALGAAFGAHIASGVDPALVAGARIWLQALYRDASGHGSSHAITTVICP